MASVEVSERADPAGEKFDISQIITELKNNEAARHKYEMVGVLGKGKFSTVYRAKCGTESVALKKVQVL